MKAHLSIEKDMIIKGTVIDVPQYGTFAGLKSFEFRSRKGGYFGDVLFLMELGQDVTATFKKLDHVTLQQGEAVVVVGLGGGYLRKDDQIEIKGWIVKIVLEDRARGESIFIQTNKIYNETLRFSLGY